MNTSKKPTSGLPRIPKSSKEQLLKTYPTMTEEEAALPPPPPLTDKEVEHISPL